MKRYAFRFFVASEGMWERTNIVRLLNITPTAHCIWEIYLSCCICSFQ